MLKQLKFKNAEIPGYFISDEGKIYDSAGAEQELKFHSKRDHYYYFKKHDVHQMMAHSFFRI